MMTKIGIWKTFAAALATAVLCSGTPADAGSKGGSRSGGASLGRRSTATLARQPIAPRLPRTIERKPRVGGIQSAERASATRVRSRPAGASVGRAGPQIDTGRLRNLGTRVEGIRSEGVNGDAAARLRLEPGIRMGRTEQAANRGDEIVKAGTAVAGSTGGVLTTIGAAQGAALGKIATGSVGTLVGGGALAGELAIAGGAVGGVAATSAAAGYAIHKGYEAVAGETIGDSWFEMLDDTPTDGDTEGEAADGRAAGAERKREREAEQNGQTPAGDGQGEGQSRESDGDEGQSGTSAEDDDAGSDGSDSGGGGCDAGEQSCNDGSDDDGADDGADDDGQSSADEEGTPNPDAESGYSAPIHDRVGGRLGREEKSRQEDGLSFQRGGGHTDPTDEGGRGRFVGGAGSFVRSEQGRERKLLEQGVEAASGGHAGAGKERKRALVPTAQELEDLRIRGGGDVTQPPQDGGGSSGGSGGIAPVAPAFGGTASGARSAASARGRLSQALEGGRLERVEAGVR
jgi:hypothetical protein